MENLTLSDVLSALITADQDFTSEHGCGAHYSVFDLHLKNAVIKYNELHKTSFDPTETLHLYLEHCEGESTLFKQ